MQSHLCALPTLERIFALEVQSPLAFFVNSCTYLSLAHLYIFAPSFSLQHIPTLPRHLSSAHFYIFVPSSSIQHICTFSHHLSVYSIFGPFYAISFQHDWTFLRHLSLLSTLKQHCAVSLQHCLTFLCDLLFLSCTSHKFVCAEGSRTSEGEGELAIKVYKTSILVFK